MQRRFLTIWFRYLKTDWHCRRQPELTGKPFVLTSPDHGRMIITATNADAQTQGIYIGMALADARALHPALQVKDDKPELAARLLKGIGEWCIRFTPIVCIDLPDSLVLDVTGCTHLWGSETKYLTDIYKRFKKFGYYIKMAIADTIGTSWAIAHYSADKIIIESGHQSEVLLSLPPAALRLEAATVERLEKLGLRQITSFMNMPRTALRRRFGKELLQRLDKALGKEEEFVQPIQSIEEYNERLPCLEPIVTAKGIEIALQRLLDELCNRLKSEGKGLRVASFKGYRMDGKIEKIDIGTNRPSNNTMHLFKLFEIKIDSLEPALGIELFTLEASKVEDVTPTQEKLWDEAAGLDDIGLSELLDRIEGKIGKNQIHRYVPYEHYWPERSFKPATSINEKTGTQWKVNKLRPLQLLSSPVAIEVTAPIPDYPPMLFRYKGKIHKILKADGPERIEQEWWLQEGKHRDYYSVEDEEGNRYWLFRSGHYDADKSYQWFLHGFFA
ncbi:MAG: DNA polymerase Y family protein [Bacteroidota bacterium]|nr:DNA polymerase Y family protein [Bacteroidota bacterium]